MEAEREEAEGEREGRREGGRGIEGEGEREEEEERLRVEASVRGLDIRHHTRVYSRHTPSHAYIQGIHAHIRVHATRTYKRDLRVEASVLCLVKPQLLTCGLRVKLSFSLIYACVCVPLCGAEQLRSRKITKKGGNRDNKKRGGNL